MWNLRLYFFTRSALSRDSFFHFVQEKLKSLRKLASEQESALSEDERTIDSLRQTIAQLQRQSGSTGGASVDIASSEEGTLEYCSNFHFSMLRIFTMLSCVRCFCHACSIRWCRFASCCRAVSSAAARKAERENAALRVELELANAQLAATQTEMLQLQQTAGASSTVPVAASSVVASAARSAVGDESVTAAVAAAVRAAEGDSDAALLKLAGEKQHLEEVRSWVVGVGIRLAFREMSTRDCR